MFKMSSAGEGKQFTFSQVPIDLNDNYSPGDNQRGDGESKQGSRERCFCLPRRKTLLTE